MIKLKRLLLPLWVLSLLLSPSFASGQNTEKFIGSKFNDFGKNNSRPVPEEFGTVFDQLTVAGFWGLRVQKNSGDVFDWSYPDDAYAYAEANNMLTRHHTLWYPKYGPKWVTPENFAEALKTWIFAYYEHYGDKIDMVDVINEVVNEQGRRMDLEAAIGGPGKTGYDWLIHVYTLARDAADLYAPNAKHIYNDAGTLLVKSKQDAVIKLVRDLKKVDPRLIDGIGCQGHRLENATGQQIKAGLDQLYSETQLPIYITEYEVDVENDKRQLEILREQFPVMLEHPAVPGVGFWGHHEKDMWAKKPNGHMIHADGTKRPSYDWLEAYAMTKKTGPVLSMDYKQDHFIPPGARSTNVSIDVFANDVDGLGNIEVYLNNDLIGIETDTEYEREHYGRYHFELGSLAPGTYSVRAAASDSKGLKTYTEEASFKVRLLDAKKPDSIIYAEADAHVRGIDSTQNYGADNLLEVEAGRNKDKTLRTFLRFDLSSIDGKVSAAFLELNVSKANSGSPSVEAMFVANDSWDEMKITSANAPSASDSIRVVRDLGEGDLVRLGDIAAVVNRELASDQKLSIQLSEHSNSQGLGLLSREHGRKDLRPRLLIHLEP